MPWNSTFPLGSVSVKANRAIGQQNTTYIETTMGNSIVGTNTVATRDHFWNVGANEDGRHRFIQSPAFTVGGTPTDPLIGTGMDGVQYLKTTNGRVQGFYRNAQGVYQSIPAFITGTVNISGGGGSDWKNLAAIPANCYGEVFLYQDSDKSYIQSGAFSSDGVSTRGFSNRIKITGDADDYMVELRNDNSNNLTLQARRGSAGSSFDGTWNYRITYRAQ